MMFAASSSRSALIISSLLQLPAISLALEPRFGQGVRNDGGNAIFEESKHNHQWCCTDAACVDSCNFFDPPMSISSPFLLLPEGDDVPPTSDIIWEYNGKEYSIWQVYSNIDGVAAPFCENLFGYTCLLSGAAVKDPHFQKWSGDWYDFHGECDLQFLRAPHFGKGVGLDVQIRTKMRHGYSYIETAAMKIGDDILEVSSFGEYLLNGVDSADLSKGAHLGPFDLELTSLNEYQHTFHIHTEGDQVVQMRTFKDFVDVRLENVNMEDFMGSQGMMGSYPSGNQTARDGITVVEDPTEFGLEWQVREDELSLFTLSRLPQHPMQCILPTATTAADRRRLGETEVTREEAEKACAHLSGDEYSMCVFDVLATQDLDMASVDAY